MTQIKSGIGILLLITVTLYSGVPTCCSSQIYHIKPVQNEECPKRLNCVMLSQFANISESLDSNTTVILLEGNHSLNSDLRVEGITSFHMFSSYDTNVTCENSLIQLQNISYALLHHLKFRGCRFEIQAVDNVFLAYIEVTRYRAIIRTTHKALQFSQTNASITKSFFSKIEADVFSDGGIIGASESNVIITECIFQNSSGYVGVAVFSKQNSNVTITKSTFRYNRVSRYGHGFTSGGIFYFQEGTFSVIHNCTIINNKLRSLSKESIFEGGVIITHSNLNVTASKFANNFPILDNFYYQGGAIRIDGHITVYIYDCLFINNYAQRGGAVFLRGGNVCIRGSIFIANTAVETGGAVAGYGILNITVCTFQINNASSGGGLYLYYDTTANINASDFIGNIATDEGGALYLSNNYYKVHTALAITACKFCNNSATNGGAMLVSSVIGNTSIKDNIFINNRAEYEGGAMHLVNADLIDLENTLISNTAARGGAVYAQCSNIFILKSNYCNNTATYGDGGALEVHYSSYMTEYRDCLLNINDSTFIHNTAYEDGGSISVTGGALVLTGNYFIENCASGHGGALATYRTSMTFTITGNDFHSNRANNGGAIHIELSRNDIIFISKSTFKSNIATSIGGAFYIADETYINVSNSTFYNNSAHLAGAIYAKSARTTSRLIIDLSFCVFVENHAKMGGALSINSTELSIYSTTTIIANNTADNIGGGVYLHQSKLSCYSGSELKILENHANKKGGGIYSWSSSIVVYYSHIYSSSAISFIKNYGGKGGGLFLSINSTIYILNHPGSNMPAVNFSDNLANIGQDVFVSDDKCTQCPINKCFFQSLHTSDMFNITRSQDMDVITFSLNQVELSIVKFHFGNCTINNRVADEIENLKSLSNIRESNTGSLLLRICFCKNGLPNCTYQPSVVHIKNFSVEVAMVDQFNHPMSADIKVQIDGGIIPKNQRIQKTKNKSCTRLRFNVFSSSFAQELVLFPLNVREPYQFSTSDKIKIPINVVACISCPIGFEKYFDEIKGCSCVCSRIIKQYVTHCDESTEIITKEHTTAWISYIIIQNSSNYLLYPYCPLNYCLPPDSKISLNLNIPNGADTQCANKRSGLLCGACRPGLSLSLGSSHCLPCAAYWPAVTVAIVISNLLGGIVLVALLLILNLTVAVGTLNGLIFYANIVATNYSTFFPSTSFFTVFLSWLNLKLGIDTCFFEGMDAYWKTWIALGFPTYLLLLIIIVIIVSENSIKFAHLIGKKNPIATLDTLILLSYVKFIQLITASYSFAKLNYPGNSQHIVWLPDATVDYLRGKHIALFLAATLVLIIGIFYTVLLFSWQWLLKYQDRKVFIWITRYLRLHVLLEPYHAPYASKHRYWTGLLLLARIILYVISAVTVSIDPAINLMVIGIVVSLLLLLITNRPYISRKIEILEIISLTNILCLCLATAYALKVGKGQDTIAFISGSVAFIQFLIILIYHFLIEICFKTKIGLSFKHKLEQRLLHADNEEDTICAPRDSQECMPLTFSVVGPPPRDELPLSVLDDVRRRGSSKPVNEKHEEKEQEERVLNSTINTTAPYHLMK